MPPAVPPAPTLSVALAAGPAEMHFCGRLWQCGQPQSITPEQWHAMQSRGAARLGFTLITPPEEN
jgi:hypothetical protein